jgi:hypothetical protein
MTTKMHTAGENRRDPENGRKKAIDNTVQADYWLSVARDAYTLSTDYFDANIRKNLERNMAHFGNRHAPGSRYYSDAYKYRHKGFRPKTRSMIRKKEAAAAVALFSTADVVHVEPERGKDPSHQVSASINQELLQYRLENTIPWFLTAMGAYQDTLVSGICISHQFWDYQDVAIDVEQLDEQGEPLLDEDGEPLLAQEYEVLRDTPAVELRPTENFKFSIAADWRDPVNTSPFLIDQIPMTIDDVQAMANPSRTSKIPWFELTDAELMQGVSGDHDALRSQRENNRMDSKDEQYTHIGFNTVWVHRNIIRDEGRDWVYYTLGVHSRLSDPIPLEEEYPHLKPGQRPYVVGLSNIEAHKNYPESITGLSASTQQAANEINNQRMDNVDLVLNRRYIINRNANIDYVGLQRNVPGGVTEVDNTATDIRIEAPPDVTQSSYQEQDRINMDFDEMTGHFSSSSVGSNRQLNETVGGMNLLSSSADSLTEYPLRVFVETWVRPVLKQLIQLEQRHETNHALLSLMGEKLDLWQKYGIDEVTDAWIQGSMNIQVNVGFGATNPQQRIEKLSMGLHTILQFVPEMQGRLDGEEVAGEVLGALGYTGVDRFFPVDKQGAELQGPQAPPPVPLSELDKAKLELEHQKHQDLLQDREIERKFKVELAYMQQEEMLYKLAQEERITMNDLQLKLKALETERQSKVDEFNIKLKMGSGI